MGYNLHPSPLSCAKTDNFNMHACTQRSMNTQTQTRTHLLPTHTVTVEGHCVLSGEFHRLFIRVTVGKFMTVLDKTINNITWHNTSPHIYTHTLRHMESSILSCCVSLKIRKEWFFILSKQNDFTSFHPLSLLVKPQGEMGRRSRPKGDGEMGKQSERGRTGRESKRK